MKFFIETQQKVKQWTSEQEGLAEGKNNPSKHPLDTEVKESEESKEHKELNTSAMVSQVTGKPQLPPKPTGTMEPVKSEGRVTTKPSDSPTKRKSSRKDRVKSPKRDRKDSVSEAVDSGLDMLADNIASWCSQMELELNELYTNSIESSQ